jgi:hypothetical protein
MGPRPTRTVRGSLAKKGFREESSHHVYLHLCAGGKTTRIFTYYSHGVKECGGYILGRMAGHLKLSRAQLDALIDCQMSGDEYIAMLGEGGHIKA